MKKIYLLLIIAFFAINVKAQVTGTKTIGVDYSTIAAAVSALNTSGVGAGGATINIPAAYTETAPTNGIILGSTILNASLSASNTLSFVKTGAGVNPVLTAFTGGTSISSDGIFKIQGSDYITINGLDVKENAANTGAALMECGYAFINLNTAAPFDGVQNTTIINCTITLNKTNPNPTFGLYASNVNAAGVAQAITAASDVNSNNKFYSNTVSNAGFGVFMTNSSATVPAAALFGQGNDIGGSSAATGNTFTNITGVAGFNAFGIYMAYQNAMNISNNTLTGITASGASTALTVGIYMFGATGSSTTNNNNITVNGTVATGVVAGIYGLNTGSFSATGNTVVFADGAGTSIHYGIYSASVGTVAMNTNLLKATNTGANTGAYYFLYHTGVATGGDTYNGNTFDNINISTTAAAYLIYASTSTLNVTATNNSIGGSFTKTGAGGIVYGYYDFGSPGSGTATITGNNFSNITLTGATGFYGIYQATGTGQIELVNNNTINNVTSGASAMFGIHHNYGAAGSSVSGNTVSNITGTAAVTGIQIGNGTASGGTTISGNTVNNISTTGAAQAAGIAYFTGTNGNIFKNKISGISANNAGATAFGLTVQGGGTVVNVYNNLIGDITAPSSSSTTDAVRGISLTAASANLALNVYNNTVHLNTTSSGANFSSSALFATASATATTSALTLRNNILFNNSIPKGTGFTSAYRRSSNVLANYTAASNNNLFYAGSGCTNNAMYYDGTTGYNTIPALQTALAPREANSKTELATPFIATTGAGTTFLHLAGSTVAESGGSPIAVVTDDYDGDTRNATTPDIGADEFTGTAIAACAGTPVAGSVSGSNNICQGSGTTLTLTGYSNSSGITLQWQSSAVSGGPFTPIACATGVSYNTGILAPGTVYFNVIVTCANGGATATTAQFAVTTNPNPTVSVTPGAPAICSNGTGVLLTASGAATYTWAPATGLSSTTGAAVTANPSSTTTYTVTGMSAAGCSSTGTVTVTVNTAPIAPAVTPTSAVICPGGIQMLTATAVAGNPNLLDENFNSTPVGALPTGWTKLQPTTTTVWGASATNNAGGTPNEMLLQCSSSTLTETGTYALNAPVVNAAGVTGLTLTFKDSLRNYSATYPYTINVETSTDNATWTNRWTYSNASGSVGHHPQTVNLSALDNQPSVYVRFSLIGLPFGAFQWYIDDVKLVGLSSPANVTWAPAAGLFTNASATTPYVAGTPATVVYAAPTATTTYGASVTGTTGCISTTNTTITVNTASVAPASANATVTTLCMPGGTTDLSVTGGTVGTGGVYKWYTGSCGGTAFATGATVPNVNVTQTTTYFVRIEGTCNNTTCASVTVTVNPAPNATISYTGSPYCSGTGVINVTRTGTAGGTFSSAAGLSLNSSTGAIDLSATTPGTYTVTYTVAASGSCPAFTTTTSITINSNSIAPTAATASNPSLCGVSGTTTLSVTGGTLAPGASYKWYTGSCGGTPFATGATVPNIIVTQTTTFYVRIEGVCNNTACVSVTVNLNPQPVVILTAATATNLTPSSTKSQIVATVSPAGDYTYRFSKNGIALNNTSSPVINLDADSAGTYAVFVTNNVTGCTASSNAVTITSQSSSTLFISPTPNTGRFSVRYYSDASGFGKMRTVQVYDNKGASIFTRSVTVNSNYTRMDVDISHHSGGSYYVIVKDADGKVIAHGLTVLQK